MIRRGIDLLASVSGDVNLPVAGYDEKWDGGVAADNVFKHFTNPQGEVNVAGVAKAFLWRDESHPADKKSGWSLPFADIRNGELQIVPAGVQACAGGHGVGQLQQGATSSDLEAIKAKIQELYKTIQSKYPDAPTNPFEGN